jgi:hypothetical protein
MGRPLQKKLRPSTIPELELPGQSPTGKSQGCLSGGSLNPPPMRHTSTAWGRASRAALVVLAAGALAGCAVKTSVVSIPPQPVVSTIYVENNPAVLMSGLLPEILTQLQAQGFQAISFTGPRPSQAIYYLTFTANWRWHWAMYLSYFHATFWKGTEVLGTAEYDARRVGPNPDKYGHTAEKIRPLLVGLLKNVIRPPPPPAGAALGR